MANIYTPYDLSIKTIIGDTAILKWDVHNAIEFKSGTKYNVYTSPDDGAYTLLATVVRTEAAVPLSPQNAFVKISSLAPMLGESDKSAALAIKGPVTLAEYKEATPVGVDELGKSRYLKIDANGTLAVSDAGIAAALAGVSTASKQDAQIALLAEIRSFFLPGLAKESKQDETIARLVDVADWLAQINNNTKIGNLVVSEADMISVGPVGAKITLPFWAKAKIEQITAIHESGTATKFTVRVWRKKTASQTRDMLAEFDSYNSPRLDVIKIIPYINLDGIDEVTIQVLPDNGTSNNFYVRIAGSLAF